MNLTSTGLGLAGLAIFIIAYAVVMAEEFFHVRKSVPVMIAAGVIWVLVAIAYGQAGQAAEAEAAVRHNILEFAELFLFILSAVTFVNTMEERQVFDALRGWLASRNFSIRQLFWLTGLFAFLISPFLDNLTTALVMGAVVMSIAANNPAFVTVSCVNIVVAANAGGAFSPFGDITTLMVWQNGAVPFTGFFHLFLPSLVNWVVPAAIMAFTLPGGRLDGSIARMPMRKGARVVIALFGVTVALTVALHQFLHLPPVLGMMTGLGALNLYSFILHRAAARSALAHQQATARGATLAPDPVDTFDIFRILEQVEWDTLMFFYGIVLCVGGLGALGYLTALSHGLYGGLGATTANILIGLISAVVDNIPIMFAVLSMNPDMSINQWLLVTLTAGVGGSLLSIGSAAGVALMGHARGAYTFTSHLKWTWAVALGYIASVLVHLLVNGS